MHLKTSNPKEERMRRNRGKVKPSRYFLYILRCQLSTVVALLLFFLLNLNPLWCLIISNLIEGVVFFWLDRMIFQRKHLRMRMWDYK